MPNTTVLDPMRVREIFMDCLFRDGEDTTDHVVAEGVVHTVGFHPQRLRQHADEISELLGELPETFRESSGGGWSFLNACMDRHGNQWTGEHLVMEQLFQLGIGIGRVKYLVPRDLWASLPGGMPYLVVASEAPGEKV